MKILKYLIKPLELIVFLCMISALIYFRSIIFHQNVNQYIDAALGFAEQQFDIEIPSHLNDAVEMNHIAQNECEPVSIANQKEEVKSIEVVVDAETSDLVNDVTATEANTVSDDKLALIDTLSDAVSAINKKVDKMFDVGSPAAAVEPVPDAKKQNTTTAFVEDRMDNLNNRREGGSASISERNSANVKQTLHMARQSFWNGNTRDSEKLYLNLSLLDDTDPNIYGELGNVYYTQGKWKQAGEAYYEAAIRLLAQKGGDQTANRVSYLLRVIQGLDTESAEKLRNKISG